MTTTSHTTVEVGPEQYRMLDFALRWVDFGGGPAEDIFVEFGVSDKVFYQRVGSLISQRRVLESDSLRENLLQVCRGRVAATN